MVAATLETRRFDESVERLPLSVRRWGSLVARRAGRPGVGSVAPVMRSVGVVPIHCPIETNRVQKPGWDRVIATQEPDNPRDSGVTGLLLLWFNQLRRLRHIRVQYPEENRLAQKMPKHRA